MNHHVARKKRAVQLLVSLALAVVLMVPGTALATDVKDGKDHHGKDKVLICYPTGVKTHPYVLLHLPKKSAHVLSFWLGDIVKPVDGKCPDKKHHDTKHHEKKHHDKKKY